MEHSSEDNPLFVITEICNAVAINGYHCHCLASVHREAEIQEKRTCKCKVSRITIGNSDTLVMDNDKSLM